jgi:hypothetical protein
LALDEGADLGGAVLADDQVAFPVAGHGPVGGPGGPVADHQHRHDEAGLALLLLAAGAAPDAASLHGRGLFIVGKLSDAWEPAHHRPRHERMVHGHSQHRCGLSSLSASEPRSTAPSGQASQPASTLADGLATARAPHLPE